MTTATLIQLAACLAPATLAFAQPPPLPSFEATSVKTVAQGGRYVAPACNGGTYAVNGQLVASSIAFAFDVPAYRLAGLPQWAGTRQAIFNIEGKAPGSVTEGQCRLFVQSLLAGRFKLSIHRETRPTPVYVLEVGKNGPKMNLADPSSSVKQVKINGQLAYDSEKGWPMTTLCGFLGRGFPGTPVIDKTGLAGRYAFEFDFTIDRDSSPGDNMAAAIQSKLGLKLESRKEPLDIIVIDRLERPTEN